ncbi:DUF1847 domain-containing protein [Clostridium paraputrificum]|uniref:DUF1847 domain-containing protein n=1 Tax=Clostridium paraputrificum TaxID=29363 RepID=UPI003D33209B
MYHCAICENHSCNKMNFETMPSTCPSLDSKNKEVVDIYKGEENLLISTSAALTSHLGYGDKTRIEETIEFLKQCNYTYIGLAFCIGLSYEAKIVSKILQHHGFSVESIICKNGAFSKESIGIYDSDVPMCNPIGQALFLNDKKTHCNILLGLCVGHDSLFFKYSEAPVTVLAVKDRVLAHNPLAAIYQADSYYKDKLFPKHSNK